MKNSLLLTLFCAFGISSIAQIANGDFENWNKLILFEHPVTGTETMSSNYETFFANGELNVNEIEGPDGQALRIENIVANSEVMPGYFIFGNVPAPEGESLIFGDGFAAQDPGVNGISLDLHYDFPNGSEGFIIVQFKENGAPVGNGNFGQGTFMFPLSGSQDWTTETFSFNGPLNASPDQCVIGIASGDVIGSDAPFEEGAFVEVDNITLQNSIDEVPGGDFESWSFVPPIFYPTDCVVDIKPFERTFDRTDASFEGMYALVLKTIDREGSVDVGNAKMGQMDGENFIPTIELDENSSSVSFMYHYSAGNDQAEATFVFYNENNGEFMPVLQRTFQLEPNFEFNMIDYDFSEELSQLQTMPTHMSIEFNSSKETDNTPQVGSVLLIDDIQMGTALGLFQSFKNPSYLSVNAFPNPTIGRVSFDFGTNRSGYYRVFNQQGTQIGIHQFSSTKIITHSLLGQPAGKYFFKFYHNAGIQSVRVVKL
ncbi:MAG TPA: T9SS type A sorting domain-containing protein [Cryomorphaceae bacterium]|nr:T9SS type A sorting domain-containing protein [Cryomorphaceae bacterium]